MAVVVDGVHAVSGVQVARLAGKIFMLRRSGPMLLAEVFSTVLGRLQIMLALHFLQKNHIGIEHADGLLQSHHTWFRANAGNALVDVVGGNSDFHAAYFTPEIATPSCAAAH